MPVLLLALWLTVSGHSGFGALLLWTTQLAASIEQWRLACGPALGDWIDSISEFEALVSLSGFTYENPSHTFPDLCEGEPRGRTAPRG